MQQVASTWLAGTLDINCLSALCSGDGEVTITWTACGVRTTTFMPD